jgi:hypothetical protein
VLVEWKGVFSMDRRIVAVGLVIIIVISIGAYLIISPIGSSFHYQKMSTADNGEYFVGVYNIRDCEVSVSFTNDTSLLYSMTIEMYESTSSSVFYFFEDSQRTLLNYYESSSLAMWSKEEVPVKKLDLVLGIGKAYKIDLSGTNLTATVIYSNGALIGQDSYFQFFSDNGSIYAEFIGDEIDDSSLGSSSDPVRFDFKLGRSRIGSYDLAYTEVNITLPYFYYGDLDVNADIIDVSASGWNRSPVEEVFSWFTYDVEGEGNPPNIYIDAFGIEVVANLVKATSA